MARSRLAELSALGLLLGLMVGCSSDASGDCNTRIGYHGAVYRPHNAMNQEAPIGRSLGAGKLLDCDGTPIGDAKVYAVAGVKVSVAVRVRGRGHGIYVVEGLRQKAWPKALQRR